MLRQTAPPSPQQDEKLPQFKELTTPPQLKMIWEIPRCHLSVANSGRPQVWEVLLEAVLAGGGLRSADRGKNLKKIFMAN